MNLKIVILFFFVICSFNLKSQQVEVQINITADEFPEDINWEIRNQFSEIIFEGDLIGCGPFQTCTENFLLDDACYIFIIKDNFGDGINTPGGYEVFINGELQGIGNSFVGNDQIDLNCKIGESCNNAIVLDLPDNAIKAPIDKDYWFLLVPDVTGLYRMNTCLNFITGTGNANTIMWVYDTCDALIHQEGAEGALGFSDDSSQCAPGSGFNYVPLDEDKEYLIRTRVVGSWPVDSITVRVQKLPPLGGCTDPAACNFNPFASNENGTCIYNNDCRPDLKLDQEELQNSIILDRVFNNDECLIEEGCLSGNGWRDVVKFSTKIDNIGNADYIVGIPERNPQNFSKENCHGHWHHQGYAEYLLFSGGGQPEPVGFKNGFCVLDLACDSDTPKYLCSYMGITAGCSDIYDNEIDCQWIDITDINDGDYTLVARVNWNRLPDMRSFQEVTYENNWGQVCINIDRSSGQLILTVLEDCEQYTDCLGISFGQAELDCNGVCGGNAEFGDLNNNFKLDENDISLYLDLVQNKLDGNLPCADLSGDGKLSIYDVTLLNQCIQINKDEADNPFHSHCTFPIERTNLDEVIEIEIANFEISLGYMDLDIRVANNDLKGFQIPFEGIVIDSFEKLYLEEHGFLDKNQDEIIGYHDEVLINRDMNFQPFLRVYFSDITSDSLCIGSNVEFVNKDFELVPVEVLDECLFLTAIDDISLIRNNVSVYPNPVKDILNIHSNKPITHLKILSLNGNVLYNESCSNKTKEIIEIGFLHSGLYLLQTTLSNGDVNLLNFIVE